MGHGLTPEEEAIVFAYRGSELNVDEIRRTFAITQTELYRLLTKAREPFRRPASARPGRLPGRRVPMPLRGFPDETPSSGTERLERRLQRLLARRVGELEDAPASDADGERLRTGQALALAVRTLATLRRVDDEGEDDAAPLLERDHPARSLGELRDELRGHLERIRDEERTRRGL